MYRSKSSISFRKWGRAAASKKQPMPPSTPNPKNSPSSSRLGSCPGSVAGSHEATGTSANTTRAAAARTCVGSSSNRTADSATGWSPTGTGTV
ncbi:hypothetical protein GCM10022630_00330 [Thermobifida alba]